MNDPKPPTNRRSFPRIVIPDIESEIRRIVGAEVEIVGKKNGPVLDISYSGAAMHSLAPREEFKVGQKLALKFQLDGEVARPIQADVVRMTEVAVAVHFEPLTVDQRATFNRFMHDKMIGLNTHQVNPKLLSPDQKTEGLTAWFHGPKDTNVFIWEAGGKIKKAIIEFDYHVIKFEGESFVHKTTLDEVDSGDDGYSAYIEVPTSEGDESSKTPAIQRSLSLLMQIPEKTKPIYDLTKHITGVLKKSE